MAPNVARAVAVALSLSLALALGLVAPRAARAAGEPLTAEDTRRVEALAAEAKAHRDAGRLDQAIAKLKEAIHIYPAAWLLYNLGRTYEDAGDDAMAKAHYELCLTKEPEAAVKTRAEEGLVRVATRLAPGRLRVDVSPVGTLVTVDGAPRGRTPIEPFELAPGAHRVRLERDGFLPLEQDVTVPAGGEAVVQQALVALPAPPREIVIIEDEEPAAPAGPYSPWQWVTLGTGAALLGGGVALFVLGEADLQEVRDADGFGTGRPVDMTARQARDLEDSGNAKRVSGIALMGVGGAALATSVVLFVLAATDAGDGAVSAPQATAAPVPGGAVFGLGGSF